MRTAYDEQHRADDRVLAVALELSKASWKVALSDARHNPRIKNADAQQPLARLEQVLALIKDVRARWCAIRGSAGGCALRIRAGRFLDTAGAGGAGYRDADHRSGELAGGA